VVFSDPMVGVLQEAGLRTGIPSFYIAFVLAPLISNYTELSASYQYALKKTTKSMTGACPALLTRRVIVVKRAHRCLLVVIWESDLSCMLASTKRYQLALNYLDRSGSLAGHPPGSRHDEQLPVLG
jgi:hypothetical protein